MNCVSAMRVVHVLGEPGFEGPPPTIPSRTLKLTMLESLPPGSAVWLRLLPLRGPRITAEAGDAAEENGAHSGNDATHNGNDDGDNNRELGRRAETVHC